jgi:hypothetical protein
MRSPFSLIVGLLAVHTSAAFQELTERDDGGRYVFAHFMVSDL